jgi:hypothetical protein
MRRPITKAFVRFFAHVFTGAMLAPAALCIALFRRNVGERIFTTPMWVGALLPIGLLTMLDDAVEDQAAALTPSYQGDHFIETISRHQTEGIMKWVVLAAIFALAGNFIEAHRRRKRGDVFSSQDHGRSRLFPVPATILTFITAFLLLPISFTAYLFFIWGTGSLLFFDLADWLAKKHSAINQRLDAADVAAARAQIRS